MFVLKNLLVQQDQLVHEEIKENQVFQENKESQAPLVRLVSITISYITF
jgi:hypothetical protein